MCIAYDLDGINETAMQAWFVASVPSTTGTFTGTFGFTGEWIGENNEYSRYAAYRVNMYNLYSDWSEYADVSRELAVDLILDWSSGTITQVVIYASCTPGSPHRSLPFGEWHYISELPIGCAPDHPSYYVYACRYPHAEAADCSLHSWDSVQFDGDGWRYTFDFSAYASGIAYPPDPATNPDNPPVIAFRGRGVRRGWNEWTSFGWNTAIEQINGSGISATFSPTATCTVSQTILFDANDGVAGQEVDVHDLRPLGLDPFVNGSFRSLLPISSTTLRYELSPDCKTLAGHEDACSYDDIEKHIVAWGNITFTAPFSVPVCTVPILAEDECPEPDFAWWQVGDWFVWLWCKLRAWFAYFVGWWLYIFCLIYSMGAIIANGVLRFVWELYIDYGEQITQIAYAVLDWFSQLATFLEMAVPEIAAWLAAAQVWAATFINETVPGFAEFLMMAVSELVPWLADLLNWFATDFLTATFGALFEIIATVVHNSSALMQFIVDQFAATLTDAVHMLGYVINMVTFIIELLSELIAGAKDALNSDTEADLFQSYVPYFWRGLTFFEETVTSTPLALLNMVAIGFIGINLLFWTIGQVGGLIDDMMQI